MEAYAALEAYTSGMKRVSGFAIVCSLFFLVASIPAVDFVISLLQGAWYNPISLLAIVFVMPFFVSTIYLGVRYYQGRFEQVSGEAIASAVLYSFASVAWFPVTIAAFQDQPKHAGAIAVLMSASVSLPCFLLGVLLSLVVIFRAVYRSVRRSQRGSEPEALERSPWRPL
jgi:hypothetical protein